MTNSNLSLKSTIDRSRKDDHLELHRQINDLKEWFHRVGLANKRRFMIGLTQRLDEFDMLKYLVHILNRVLGKDYTYTRSRTNPSLPTDNPAEWTDHALKQKYIDDKINQSLDWFEHASSTNKSTFLFSLLIQCDIQLLHSVVNVAKAMVAAEFAIKPLKEPVAYVTSGLTATPSMVYTDPLGYTSSHAPEFSPTPGRTKTAAPHLDNHHELHSSKLNQNDFITTRHDEPLTNSFSKTPASTIHTRTPATYIDVSKTSTSGRLTSTDVIPPRPKSSSSRPASRISANPSTIYTQIVRDDNDELVDMALVCGAKTLDTTYMVHPLTPKGHSGVWDTCDFIRDLPIHLAKYILSFLDAKSMKSAENVSKFWRLVIREVRAERNVLRIVRDDCLLMQGGAAAGVNPAYANDIDVPVPVLDTNTLQVLPADMTSLPSNTTSYFYEGYLGCQTRNVIMEERNVFCGTYNVMIIIDKDDTTRVIHTDGELIAIATGDRKIRLHDKTTGQQFGPVIHGHAGTIKCLHVDQRAGRVISGSYDTTIRHWNMDNGECLRIYQGHQGTVTSIRVWQHLMASCSKDKTCKVWNLTTGELQRTYRHQTSVTAVAIDEFKCVTGDDSGVVKVWDNESGQLVKVLKGHTGAVTSITFDKWHIVTGSKDTYAMLWSNQGKYKKCLTLLRHQKPVLCVEMLYLRVVTGSYDGRIRIWNSLTGNCCRIMRGNSRSDPVLSLVVIGNIITINTQSNVIRLNFEEIDWDYAMDKDHIPPMFTYGQYSDLPVKHRPHCYTRAKRIKISGTPAQLMRNEARRVKSACTIDVLQKQKEQVVKPRVKSARFALDSEDITSKLSKDNLEVKSVALYRGIETDSSVAEEPINRRLSWGFDKLPCAQDSKDLQKTKALWRQQIRNPCPLTDADSDTTNNKRDRPNSSPSKIDPRIKSPVAQIQAELGRPTSKHQNNAVSEISPLIVPKTPPMESRSNLGKIESIKNKIVLSKGAINLPKRAKPAAQALSCRLSGVVHSPFKDPLRLKQAFRLKTYEQETS